MFFKIKRFKKGAILYNSNFNFRLSTSLFCTYEPLTLCRNFYANWLSVCFWNYTLGRFKNFRIWRPDSRNEWILNERCLECNYKWGSPKWVVVLTLSVFKNSCGGISTNHFKEMGISALCYMYTSSRYSISQLVVQ